MLGAIGDDLEVTKIHVSGLDCPEAVATELFDTLASLPFPNTGLTHLNLWAFKKSIGKLDSGATVAQLAPHCHQL